MSIQYGNTAISAIKYCNSSSVLQDVTSVVRNGTQIYHYETPYAGLKFTAETAGSTVSMTAVGGAPSVTLLTSTDGITWNDFTVGSTTITLTNVGDYVYFKAGASGNTGMASYISRYNRFNLTGRVAASGNIQSLLDASLARTDVGTYCYNYMFSGCTSLTTAPSLPATTLKEDCYSGMFSGCTSLTTAPTILPATILKEDCYYEMFDGCTSLITVPTISATTLAEDCCNGMFYNCTSLTTAPTLSATTLAPYCYQVMFKGCTSLTTAPSLSATTLTEGCYYEMFSGCTSLTTAPSLPATTLTENCYTYMFYGCTSLTTAPSLPATTLTENCYNCMFAECRSLTTAPTLPATTLADSCYDYMFYGCPSLKISENGGVGTVILNIPSGTAVPSYWNDYMFYNTGGTFTGNPTVGNTYYCYQ